MSAFVSQKSINCDAAAKIAQGAIQKAEELGIKINVAVTDSSGVLMAFLRMPGAFLHSIDISIDKAYTAASFGFPTSQWMSIIENDPALREGIVQRPRLVIFGGGVPVRVGDDLIGGVGVSGGSAEEDEICALAGISKI
ncbi:heme-binding protein [Polynucleobacter sp. MWH-Spelu-300-X4]|uniref:GlcG/HbpS family heme-binding protein n=1 Tax=Polynucleobacter sp. MWH-Spelu-300-X4 TaxID=2689109 RepID=UPI001BFD3752|nr:heme-binding protein [Polynucleobacter sp. MWH-Spelu-300-X4]QWD79911.1 heme-binding protein [Polynucleobacter sp. MWH-Spelu-300-X4]